MLRLKVLVGVNLDMFFFSNDTYIPAPFFWAEALAIKAGPPTTEQRVSINILVLGALACIPAAILFSLAAIFWRVHHKHVKTEICHLNDELEKGNDRRRLLREAILTARRERPDETFSDLTDTSNELRKREDDVSSMESESSAGKRRTKALEKAKSPTSQEISGSSFGVSASGISGESTLRPDTAMEAETSDSDDYTRHDASGLSRISIDSYGNVKKRFKRRRRKSKLLNAAGELEDEIYEVFGGKVGNLRKPTVAEQNARIMAENQDRGSVESVEWNG